MDNLLPRWPALDVVEKSSHNLESFDHNNICSTTETNLVGQLDSSNHVFAILLMKVKHQL